ncbi:MAG: NAD(P)H-hydrate dehydratase [Streptococcaceae bacterium]|nr:NAD(P)H-hydrate dehydratase [Streptococcaceae bacterium]
MKITENILRQVILPRKENSQKSDYGRALLIGGIPRYAGAIIMAANACVSSGAGLVTVATDAKNRSSLLAYRAEVMVLDWLESQLLTQAIQKSDVILLGPGMGESSFSLTLVKEVLRLCQNQILIIDASAINLFAAHQDLLTRLPKKTIFTPHQKELERLSGLVIPEQSSEKIQAFCEQIQAVIVAKSHQTKIFVPNHLPFELTNGTPAMATGGMGDTLAGMIAGFTCQFKRDLANSIACATYLHSQIATELAKEHYVVLPHQITENISRQMKFYENKDELTPENES